VSFCLIVGDVVSKVFVGVGFGLDVGFGVDAGFDVAVGLGVFGGFLGGVWWLQQKHRQNTPFMSKPKTAAGTLYWLILRRKLA